MSTEEQDRYRKRQDAIEQQAENMIGTYASLGMPRKMAKRAAIISVGFAKAQFEKNFDPKDPESVGATAAYESKLRSYDEIGTAIIKRPETSNETVRNAENNLEKALKFFKDHPDLIQKVQDVIDNIE